MGYIQLVEFATHNQGNTLDLVFTPSDEEGHPKDIVSCSQGSFISDHCSIIFALKVETKNATLQRISYKNLKHINNQQLSYTIRDAFANISFADMNVNEALDILETSITIALDKHAPMQSKLKKKRILTPWFDEELKNQRRKTKRTDEKWRKYKEHHLWLAHVKERRIYTALLRSKRKEVISNEVSGCGKDTKKLYKLVSNITSVHKDNPLPDSESNQDLADKFADYFMEQINKIRDALKDKPLYQPTCRDAPEPNPVAEDEVTKYIGKLATKSCELDSFPTKLLKEIIDVLITPITSIYHYGWVSFHSSGKHP